MQLTLLSFNLSGSRTCEPKGHYIRKKREHSVLLCLCVCVSEQKHFLLFLFVIANPWHSGSSSKCKQKSGLQFGWKCVQFIFIKGNFLFNNVVLLYLTMEVDFLSLSHTHTHTNTPLCSGVGGCGSPPRYHQLNTILLFMSFSFILIHLKKSKKPHLCWSIVAKPCTNMFNF